MNFENLKIGHVTLEQKGTGATVFLFEKLTSCAWFLCGSSPATRDVNVLNADASVGQANALLFCGGSAYGLGAANGAMQWLLENKQGYETRYGLVPIVPTADIYDFGIKGMHFPTAEEVYAACCSAQKNNTLSGRIGAGTGASVGKWLSHRKTIMSGGYGFAQLRGPDNLQVLACCVVNSVGDIVNEKGQIIAGACDGKGNFVDMHKELLVGHFGKTDVGGAENENTTLVAIFTNAIFDRISLTRIAKMASAGIARATLPAFSRYDGDVVFTASVGDIIADEMIVGTLAASATHQAILNAVSDSILL